MKKACWHWGNSEIQFFYKSTEKKESINWEKVVGRARKTGSSFFLGLKENACFNPESFTVKHPRVDRLVG